MLSRFSLWLWPSAFLLWCVWTWISSYLYYLEFFVLPMCRLTCLDKLSHYFFGYFFCYLLWPLLLVILLHVGWCLQRYLTCFWHDVRFTAFFFSSLILGLHNLYFQFCVIFSANANLLLSPCSKLFVLVNGIFNSELSIWFFLYSASLYG